jgi:hypothetical protein
LVEHARPELDRAHHVAQPPRQLRRHHQVLPGIRRRQRAHHAFAGLGRGGARRLEQFVLRRQLAAVEAGAVEGALRRDHDAPGAEHEAVGERLEVEVPGVRAEGLAPSGGALRRVGARQPQLERPRVAQRVAPAQRGAPRQHHAAHACAQALERRGRGLERASFVVEQRVERRGEQGEAEEGAHLLDRARGVRRRGRGAQRAQVERERRHAGGGKAAARFVLRLVGERGAHH